MGTVTTLMPLWKVLGGIPKYAVSGTVTDGGGTGVSGVTITLTGDASGSTTTAADGSWSFSGSVALLPGSYTVTPTKTGYTFNPTSAAVTVTTADVVVANFAALGYLLRDEFTTAEAAPLTSPRTCEPGPGTLTIVDTGNNASITGGKFTTSGTAGTGDPGFYYDFGTPAARTGIACFCKAKTAGNNDRFRLGFDNSSENTFNNGAFVKANNATGTAVEQDRTATVYTSVDGTEYAYLIIPRVGGNFFIRDGEMLWVGVSESTWDSIQFVGFAPYNLASATTADEFSLIDLPDNGYTAWDTEFGAATAYNETPSTGATLTSEANAFHEFTWTAATGETLEWMIRRTDDTSTWSIRCDQAGSTIKTIEINSGETERASTAQTWTNATTYRITVVADEESIFNFVNSTTKNSYSSASFNKTATGVKITGFAAGADLVAWPRDVSSLLPAELV